MVVTIRNAAVAFVGVSEHVERVHLGSHTRRVLSFTSQRLTDNATRAVHRVVGVRAQWHREIPRGSSNQGAPKIRGIKGQPRAREGLWVTLNQKASHNNETAMRFKHACGHRVRGWRDDKWCVRVHVWCACCNNRYYKHGRRIY